MNTSSYEYFVNLQYKVKVQAAQLEAFKSGAKYQRMELEKKRLISHYEGEIRKLKKELSEAHTETVNSRNAWIEIMEQMDLEYKMEISKLQDELQKERDRIATVQNENRKLRSELREEKKLKYAALVELDEEKGKNAKLIAQINHNYENSSLPSSASPNHKKITNNREKTGRTQGAQAGHTGHGRKTRTPDKVVVIETPVEFLDTAKYRPTGRIISKQLVSVKVQVNTTEYRAEEYVEISSGHKVHAAFPDGVADDVNYDGSIKAMAYLLNNECNVSIENTRKFISEITNGDLELSCGLINSLSRQLSKKTEQERKEIFSALQETPIMHIDFTNARVNGAGMDVLVCANGSKALYMAREHKGKSGVSGSPIEDYTGTLIHDHDVTFYNYGSFHQECLAHVLRYLKDSILNEKNLTWNSQMAELLREMIHYRNSLSDSEEPDKVTVKEYERRYDEVIKTAKTEYEYEPPSKYYIDGYNLYRRLDKYKGNHLLFLHDKRVDSNNNLSERLLRSIKRKMTQAMTLRSFDSLDCLCNGKSIVYSLRANNQNVFNEVSIKFGTPTTAAD